MVDKHKSQVKADIKNNRLHISMSTAATKSEMNKVYTDVRFCIADLKPGFDVIVDLSHCIIGHLNAIGIYRKISDYLVINKVGRVIRIVEDRSILLKQVLSFAAKFQGYRAVYVNSLEEAEEELLYPIKPQALRFRINQRQVEYSTNHIQEQGNLIDISTSGCAVQGPTSALSVDQEITLSIPLYQEDDTLLPFVIPAKVVRVLKDQFAAMFLDVVEERQEELYQCLIHEVQREKI